MKDRLPYQVIKAFFKEPSTIVPFGSGHIHDTYKVTQKAKGENYLLQYINHKVFKDVTGMMQNIQLVTEHLSQKLDVLTYPSFFTLKIVPTLDGKPFFYKSAYGYWRVYTFVENSIGYDRATSAQQAAEAGKAFGLFQALLADMDASQLVATIPNFHNMVFRLQNLDNAIKLNKAGRLNEVKGLLQFVESRRQSMRAFYKEIEQGKVPNRITHNDTKFNNVLLDAETQKAKAVVDLDTAMPGTLLYDFGDAIRTICNTREEDEPIVESIDFAIPFFKAFTKSYFKEVGQTITPKEKEMLVFSAKYMTMIMGIRFLTDFLEGDVYYKTNHKQHNLNRVRAQFKLIELIEEKEVELQRIVEKICR